MQSVLFGNGLIIQYGGEAYTNARIIQRARENVASGKYPQHLYSKQSAEMLEALHVEYPSVLGGEYDMHTTATFEKTALEDFKRRYAAVTSPAVGDIGFEDYFLIFELVYNKAGIGNPDRFQGRAVIRRMLLDAVFNGGDIQRVYGSFPNGLREFLQKQDQILTTNYDRNLEEVGRCEVLHLHGAFDVLGADYDPNSIRHHMSEDLLDGERVDPDYLHLYSSCLVSYVSDMKTYAVGQADLANSGLDKFATGYANDPNVRRSIDAWDVTDPLVRRLSEAIKLKVEHPELSHTQPYPVGELGRLSGTLAIAGLSTRNDGHLFAEIDGNHDLESVDYFFFDPREGAEAEALLLHQDVRLHDVGELWTRLESGA